MQDSVRRGGIRGGECALVWYAVSRTCRSEGETQRLLFRSMDTSVKSGCFIFKHGSLFGDEQSGVRLAFAVRYRTLIQVK